MAGLVAALASWITALVSAAGYGGVMLLMAIESAGVPLPSELIMPFAGYLVSTHRFVLLPVALSGAIGCNLGSVLAYWVGAAGGRPFVARFGKYALVRMHDVDLAERFFARFGGITVLVSRMLPVVRTFIAVPAGMARMNLVRFHVYTFVGSFAWCLALAYMGEQLGAHWETSPVLHAVMRKLDVVAVLAVAVLGAWFVVSHLKRK